MWNPQYSQYITPEYINPRYYKQRNNISNQNINNTIKSLENNNQQQIHEYFS